MIIVEYVPDLQEVLEYNLRQAGHEVFVTKLGREGLRIAREQKPEVVLLDVNGKSAEEAAQEIRDAGGAAASFALDGTRHEDCSAIAKRVAEHVGTV